MAYKVKKKKKPSPIYFREKELRKYKGKKIPFPVLARAGTRKVAGIHKKIYKKGAIIEHEGKIARVKRITKRGIYINYFTKPNGLPKLSKKEIFISSKKIEEGLAYPFVSFIAV